MNCLKILELESDSRFYVQGMNFCDKAVQIIREIVLELRLKIECDIIPDGSLHTNTKNRRHIKVIIKGASL